MRRSRLVAAAAAALALAAGTACSSDDDGDEAATTPSATAPAPSTAQTAPAPVAIVPLADVGAQTIEARPFADWVLVAFRRAWVTGVGSEQGIARYDVATGRLLGTAPVEGFPCGAPDAGFGALWIPTCENRAIHRVDPATGRVTATIAVTAPGMGEYTIGAGEGGVWTIADAGTCQRCALVRIDPATDRVADRYDVPPGGVSVRAGLGGVWIAYPGDGLLRRIHPRTGEVVAEITVGAGPRFMDVGAGAVWVMNQVDGSVSRVDPSANTAVATIPVDAFIDGGDLTVGDGSVWVRATEELVARIDPRTNTVVARIGGPEGSGSASAGDGQLWASAHDVFAVYRIPIADIPTG